MLNLVDEPLATLPLERVRPGRAVLDEVMESLTLTADRPCRCDDAGRGWLR